MKQHVVRGLAALLVSVMFAGLLGSGFAGEAPAAMNGIDRATLDKWAAPYRGWHHQPDHVIPAEPRIPGFETFRNPDCPCVYQLPGQPDTWYMNFIGFNGKGYNSFVVESTDLVKWTDPRLAMGFGKKGEFDHGGCVVGAYLYESYDIKAARILKKRDGKFWTLYGCYAKQDGYECDPGYEGVATSEDGLTWRRVKDTPILSVDDQDCAEWEKDCIYQPWLVEHEGTFYNFYNAKHMPDWIEQMGGARSSDLLNWKRFGNNPIVKVRKGTYDDKFCSDGKVFRDGDHWVMFYFGVGKGGAHIMAAFSRDLVHWTAHPEPLYQAGGNPSGLDRQFAHKMSLVHDPKSGTYYLYYCACGNKGRGIGLITSKPIPQAGMDPAAPAPALSVATPQDYQVFQRSTKDQGVIGLRGRTPDGCDAVEARITGTAAGGRIDERWQDVPVDRKSGGFCGERTIAAGGWYQVELRASKGGRRVAALTVEHVGVGEVFVVAGQSNSANHGSVPQKPVSGMVATTDGARWHLADDPQPGASGRGGSFIPSFGDALAARCRVPVGVACLGAGGTSVREWLPKGRTMRQQPTTGAHVVATGPGEWASTGMLFDQLMTRIEGLGKDGFRAVLWHQGESDAGQARHGAPADRQITGRQYGGFMTDLIGATRARAGWAIPWMTAQTTFHTEQDAQDDEFRSAQKALWETGVSLEGPDTDQLRSPLRDGVHFNGAGLKKHGEAWADKVGPWLDGLK